MKVDLKYTSPKTVYDYNKNVKISDVNFGFSLPHKVKVSHSISRRLKSEASELSNRFFTNDTEGFYEILQNSGKKQRNFLRTIARRYSDENYYLADGERESVKDVLEIFNGIQKPSKYHYFVLSHFRGSFTSIENILKGINKKNFKYLGRLHNKVYQNHEYSNDLLNDIYASPYKNKYLRDFWEYSSYFALNKNNKNAVSELDTLIREKSFDRAVYDAKYAARQIMSHSQMKGNSIMSEEFFEKNYSDAAASFVDDFMSSYVPHRKMSSFSTENSFDLMHMFKTSNNDNIGLRYRVMQMFKYSTKDRYGKDNTQSEITEMRKLFDKIDHDKYTREFVRKFVSSSSNIHSIRTLNNLLDTVGSKKADIYFDNFVRLVNKSSLDEQKKVLEKGIENPFYETDYMKYRRRTEEYYNYRKPMSRYKRAKIIIGNFVNKVKFNLSSEETKFVPINSLAEQNGYKPAQIHIASPAASAILENHDPSILQPSIIGSTSLNLVSGLKLSPKARRLMVAQSVNDIISKALGAKTLEKQSESYKANAKAMRLKLLPEIFNSIKETRMTDRAVGKKRGSSASKDALALYNLINGRNKKLVRYLLTKRNTDNTRMFEVKDIIAIIDKSENKIKNSGLNAKDAKNYYEKLYQAHIQMYGKPNLAKKSAVKSRNAVNPFIETNNNLRLAVS